MRPARYIFAIWFALFTQMSGMAWACNECSELAAQTAILAADGELDHDHLWSVDRCSDHCGHAAAHVIAIGAATVAVLPSVGGEHDDQLRQMAWYSAFQPPPYHPPIG